MKCESPPAGHARVQFRPIPWPGMEAYTVMERTCRMVPVCEPVCEPACPPMGNMEWFARKHDRHFAK